MNYRKEATKAAQNAVRNPKSWFGADGYDEQVCFADGIYSVGSNGDADDYEDIEDAIDTLAYQWEMQDEPNVTAYDAMK